MKGEGITELNELTAEIIGAGMTVHTELGPGLLESAYETCLALELSGRGLSFERQWEVPVRYKGAPVAVGYRVDLLVEDRVIVELKSVTQLAPIHEAQVLTYLRLSGRPLGLLINFNVQRLKDGIRRLILTPSLRPLRTPW